MKGRSDSMREHKCRCKHHDFKDDCHCNRHDFKENCHCKHHENKEHLHCHKCRKCHHKNSCKHCSSCQTSFCDDCHDFFNINFAGLRDNLNFKLLENYKCRLSVELVAGRPIKGKTCNVGIDFIDIKRDDGKIVTILKDKVSHIVWDNKRCPRCRK